MYHFNEGSLELPQEWKDQTVHMIVSSQDESPGLSFTISRDILPWGMTFDEFVNREILSLGRQLQEFNEVSRDKKSLGNHEAIVSEFRWQAAQGKIHQQMTVVNLHTKVVIFTATMQEELTINQKKMIQSILQTFKVHD